MKNELADKINTLEQMKSGLKDNVGGTSEQMEDIKNILSTLATCRFDEGWPLRLPVSPKFIPHLFLINRKKGSLK